MLSAIVDELRRELIGQPVSDVVQLETHRFLLRFGSPPFPRLHISVHPGLSTLHLARGTKAPASPTELAVALSAALASRRVTALVQPESERVVRLEFDGGLSLVIELMGKASNVLLLDRDGRITRFVRSHEGGFRKPQEGAVYQPPPPSSQWRVAVPHEVTPSIVGEFVAEARGEGAPSLAELLAVRLPGFSALLAREVAFLVQRGEDAWAAVERLRKRGAGHGSGRSPVVYAPAPLAGLTQAEPLNARRIFAFPFPLAHADEAGLTATPFGTMNEAEAAFTQAMVRHMAFASLRQALTAMLRREARRARELERALAGELEEAEAAGTRDRRRGELILAGLRSARKEGAQVRVPDVYEQGSPLVSIPIDPRLDLRANAERLFKTARRADRARQVIPARLETVRRRVGSMAGAEERLDAAASMSELESLEKQLQDEGLVRAVRRAQRAEVGRAPAWVPVREFRSAEGFTILVGRSASDNDHITFNVAAPHDLWLHAAGYPGAHVIVRNPRRLAELPEATVREAAELAAWMSRGKEEGELDVHVAWRRHVRKGRGMSPGMVMLRRHRTVRVTPKPPFH
ncbi:MAG: Rqc2 family fibronectin-binding protein [Candidatus Polarisedimenticolia bacterium]